MNERSLAYSEQAGSSAYLLNANHIAAVQENPGVVNSLLHPLAILIRQVLTRPGRAELNLILIDDEENILQALDSGVALHSLYYSGEEMLSNALTRKLPASVGIYEVAKRTCKKIFENDKVSRVFAIAHTPAAWGLNDLLETERDIVALEDLTISGNIGAIVRTSLAFGVGSVILLNADPVDIYDRRMIRASRGHVFSLPVATATTDEMIRFSQENDLPILAMSAQADHLLHEAAALSRRLVIVFGSEKDGCSQTLRDAAMLQVQIPIHSKVESLNVSTAAGIMLFNRLWFNHPQA
ncbi:MAG TPA: RNA methyltransferase [Anaerolineales bacterium]|nr:RNA methyltransferase [Anaerolineales bacterium]